MTARTFQDAITLGIFDRGTARQKFEAHFVTFKQFFDFAMNFTTANHEGGDLRVHIPDAFTMTKKELSQLLLLDIERS